MMKSWTPVQFFLRWAGVKRKDPPSAREVEPGVMFKSKLVDPQQPDWSAICRGASDVTGEKWRKYSRSKKPMWNACEMDTHFTANGSDDPILDRIRNYKGPLRSDPRGWPELYRKPWFETHK
jgi:hypothetical protein